MCRLDPLCRASSCYWSMDRFAQVKFCCLMCRNGRVEKRGAANRDSTQCIQSYGDYLWDSIYTDICILRFRFCFHLGRRCPVTNIYDSMFQSVNWMTGVKKKEIITFQDQLGLFSGLGTGRSAHTGSCHDITALKQPQAHRITKYSGYIPTLKTNLTNMRCMTDTHLATGPGTFQWQQRSAPLYYVTDCDQSPSTSPWAKSEVLPAAPSCICKGHYTANIHYCLHWSLVHISKTDLNPRAAR